MYPHHDKTINQIKEAYINDPNALSVIIGGSVAKGWAKENSDVDILLVTTEEKHADAEAANQLTLYRGDLTDYEGGYVDGKVITLPFIRLIAERGSEPSRSMFLGARVLFDKTGEVQELVDRILTYPEEGLEERIRRFHSQLVIWGWYTGEAFKRQDSYLLSKSVSEIGFYAMRLILAVNKRIYPYHKWVTQMVRETPNKPEAIIEKILLMVESKTPESIKDVIDTMNAWGGWTIDYRVHCQDFLQDSEFNWVDHPAPIADL